MKSELLHKAGRKLFASHLEQYAPADPLYEQYTDNKGRKKRRKREIPPGLSARDEKILKAVKRRAYHLDRGFSIGGMRFGWAFIIGIIPGAGDVADIALNYYLVVSKAREADLPGWLVRRMMLNNSISALVGLVPFVGDIILAQFKANWRNAALLEEFLRIRGETYLEMKAEGKDVVPVGTPKPKDKKKKKKQVQASNSSGKEVTPPKGTSKSDAEQIKPGAGLEEGEVIQDLDQEKNIKADESSAAAAAVTPATGKTTGKRRLSLTPWRGRDSNSSVRKGKQVSDRGRFVEHIQVGSEVVGGSKQET